MSEKTGGMWHLYWSGGKKDPSLTELLNEKFRYFKLNLPFLPARQISAKVFDSLGIPHFCGIVDRTRLFKMYQDSRKPQLPLVETPAGRRNKFFKVRPLPAIKGYPLKNLSRKSSGFSSERRDKSTAGLKPKGSDTPFRTRKSVTFSQGVRVIDISPNPERKNMRTPSGGGLRPRRDLAEAGTPAPPAIEESDLRTRELVPEIHTEQDILPETRTVVRHELVEARDSAEASVTEYVPEDGLHDDQYLAEPRSFTGQDIMNIHPDQEEFNPSSRADESVLAEPLSPEGEPPSAFDTSEETFQDVVTDTPKTSVVQENFTISRVPLKETQIRNKNPASSEEDASLIEGSVSDPGTDIEIPIRTLTNLSLAENAILNTEDVIQNNISEHEKIAEKNKVELLLARDNKYKLTSLMSKLKNKSPDEENFENMELNSSSVEDRNQDSFNERVEKDHNVFELNINPAEESDEPEKVDDEEEAREHVDLSASERSFSVQTDAGGDEANRLSIREPQVYTEDHKSPSEDPNEKVNVTDNYETSFLRRARIMRYRETDESSLASENELLSGVDDNDEPSPIKENDTITNTDNMSFLREATSCLDLRDKESPRATEKSHQPCSIVPRGLDFTGEVLKRKSSTISVSLSRDNTVQNVESRPPSEERSDADHGSPLIPESPRATKKSHEPFNIVPRGLDFTGEVVKSKSSTMSVSMSRDNTVQNVQSRPPSKERSDADHGSPLIPESPRATKKSHEPCNIVSRGLDSTGEVLKSKSSTMSVSMSRDNTVQNVESRPPSEERSDADHGSPLIPESPRATKKSHEPCNIVSRGLDSTGEVLKSKSSTMSVSLSRDNTVQNVESRPPSEERSDADHGSPLIPESPRATKKSHEPCNIVSRGLDSTGEVLKRKSSTTSVSMSRDNTVQNVESRPPSEERSDADHGSPLIPESPRATKKSHQPCNIVSRGLDFTGEVQKSKSSTTSVSLSRDNTVQNVESRPPSQERSDADHGSPLIPESPRATKKSHEPCNIVSRGLDSTGEVLKSKSSTMSVSMSRDNTVQNVESRPPSEERSDADHGSPLIPESPRATKKSHQPCNIVSRGLDFTGEVQKSKSSTTSVSMSRDNTVKNVESRLPPEEWWDADQGSPLESENVDLNQSNSEFYTSDIIVSPGNIASFEEVSTAYETEKETGRLKLNRYIRKQDSGEIKKDVSSSQETEPAPTIEEIPSRIVDRHLEHYYENRLTSLSLLDCTSTQETKSASQFLKSIAKNEFDIPEGDLPPERDDILCESNSGSSPNRDLEQEIVFDTDQRMGITKVQHNSKELADRYDGIEAADQNNNATLTHEQTHLKSNKISFLQEWFQSRQVLEEVQVSTEPVNSKNTASKSLSIINETGPEGRTFPLSNSKNNAKSRNAVEIIDSKDSDEGILKKIPYSQVKSSVSIICNTDSLKNDDRGSLFRKLTELKEKKKAEVLIESENNKRELYLDTSKMEDSRSQNAGDSPPKGGSGSGIVESSEESPDLRKTRGRKRKKSRQQRARFLKNRPAVNTVSSSEEDSSYLGGNKRGRHTWHSAFKKNSQAPLLKMKKRLSWHEGVDRKLKTHQSAQKQSTEPSKVKAPRYQETKQITNESVLANLNEITPEKRILNENRQNSNQRTEHDDQGKNVSISDLSHVVRAKSFELFKEKNLIPSHKDAEKPFQKPKTIREALLYEKWYRSQLGYSVSSERTGEVDPPRSINSGVTHEAETGAVSADTSSITSREKSKSSVVKIRESIKDKLSEVTLGYFSKASELQTQSTTTGSPTLSAVNPTTHTKSTEVSDGINKRKRKLFAEDEATGVTEEVTNPENIQLVSAQSDESIELSHSKQTKRHRIHHSEEKENLATHPENMNPSRSGIPSHSISRNAPVVGVKRIIKPPSTKGKEIESKGIASPKSQHEGIVEKLKRPTAKSSVVQWHNTASTSSTASNESAALTNLYRRSFFIPSSPSPNQSYSKS